MKLAKTPGRRSTRKKKKYATLDKNFKATPSSSSMANNNSKFFNKRGKSNKKMRTPMLRTRSASNELLAAASSPTNAASRCAESLKRSFDSSSSASISVYVRVKPVTMSGTSNSTEDKESTGTHFSNTSTTATARKKKRLYQINEEKREEEQQHQLQSQQTPKQEGGEEEVTCFNVESETTLIHRICGQQGKRFLMDKIFEETATQEEIFKTIGKQQVDKALSGFHGSIFAYGQTGTGKTYTMLGPNGGHGNLKEKDSSKCIGLIPRILHYLFENISKESKNTNTVNKVTVSYLEIYNENIRDLLHVDDDSNDAFNKRGKNLLIKEHKTDGPFVKNLVKKVVTTPSEALNLMEQGNLARTSAKTRMNDTSSRSHAVFTIRIDGHMQSSLADGRKRKFISKMNLVDLAGSERQKNTGTTGKRLREGSTINKSLSVLGTVIMNLVEIGGGRKRHVSSYHYYYCCYYYQKLKHPSHPPFSFSSILFCFYIIGSLP
jgi:hypothetical protein